MSKHKTGSTEILSPSAMIAKRCLEKGIAFKANDNISEVIHPSDMILLKEEVQENVKRLLKSLVIDIENDPNSMETAERVSRMYLEEVFAGRYVKRPKSTSFPNSNRDSQNFIVLGPFDFASTCSHHMVPIMGSCSIGVKIGKSKKLVGISKYPRIVEWVMKRPQIQEEALNQILEETFALSNPEGVIVSMKAQHFCMHMRGVEQHDAVMSNVAVKGKITDEDRATFFHLTKENK